jgi:lysophospholipase L1-like esterase
LALALDYTGSRPARVIVISIPDWGMTPFGRNQKYVSAEIDVFNAVNREEASKAGAHYVDITPISRQAVSDPALTASDGLHPSASMYAQWVEQLVSLVIGELQAG